MKCWLDGLHAALASSIFTCLPCRRRRIGLRDRALWRDGCNIGRSQLPPRRRRGELRVPDASPEAF
jgi:hypothetical protein